MSIGTGVIEKRNRWWESGSGRVYVRELKRIALSYIFQGLPEFLMKLERSLFVSVYRAIQNRGYIYQGGMPGSLFDNPKSCKITNIPRISSYCT